MSAEVYVPVTVAIHPVIPGWVISQYRVKKLVALELFGCFASTTETPMFEGKPLPAVIFTVIGEYSGAPGIVTNRKYK